MALKHRGLWFPLSLAGLLLLTVPGLVFLGLTLLGREGAVNGWLQEHFSISYHNPLPASAAVAILLVPFLLTLLYFLKLKRKPLQVPSTFLWKKSIEDLHVNSLFQWLRDNVLLLLQLLTLLLLIYALMGFQVHGRSSGGVHYILIIDNSASMAVSDVSPSRLETARREAQAEIDRHGDDDFGMVIAFNSRATLLQPYTNDRGLLRRAVESIQQTNRPTRVEEALALAESLANPRQSTDDSAVRPAGEDASKARTYVAAEGVAAAVHLYSDGRFADAGDFAAGNLALNFHRVGIPGPAAVDNIGLVTLDAKKDEREPGKLQVFARVLNFRAEPVKARLQLEVRVGGRDGFTLHEKPLALPARVVVPADPEKNEAGADTPGEGAAIFSLTDLDGGAEAVLHARLLDVRDQFPLDDEAWLVIGVARKARVLIVTDGNDILSNFFDQDATRQVADVQYLKPAALATDAYARPVRAGQFDLVVFDRCAPPNVDLLPPGNTFFIDNVPPPWQRAALPPLKSAKIQNPTSKHPLMQHLTALDDIAFTEAFRFDFTDARVPPRTPRLLETDRETAVLFALARGSHTDLVLAFPLINARGEWTTTWNLKLSFPVFLRNVLYVLGNVRDVAAEENVQPGQVASLRPGASIRQVDIAGPGGLTETLTASGSGEFLYKDTDRPGVYSARWQDAGRSFAVNLLDAEESNIQPRDEVRIGAQEVRAEATRGATRETWKWIALAALAALMFEWLYYHRRV